MITFTIPGKPQPKQRPRTVRRGNKSTTYTPDATKKAEDRIKQIAHITMLQAKQKPFECPVCVTMTFHVERRATATPDLDNLVKVVGDAINKVVYKDDSQVVLMEARKFQDKENPRTIVSVWGVE